MKDSEVCLPPCSNTGVGFVFGTVDTVFYRGGDVEPEPVLFNIDAPVFEAHIDYIRLTHRSVTDMAHLADRTQNAVAEARADYWRGGRYALSDWTFVGYNGNTDGKISWGVGAQGTLIQATGWAAQSVAVLDVPYTGVPRLDICATLWGCSSSNTLAREISAASDMYRQEGRGNRWKIRLVNGYGDGDTVYLGSRSSEWFVRCYDKGAEDGSDEYQGAFRFEVEAHNKEAAALYVALGVQGYSEDAVMADVKRYMRKRGVELLARVPLADAARVALRQRALGGVQERLEWLRRQVRPTVTALTTAGFGGEVIDALGLTVDGVLLRVESDLGRIWLRDVIEYGAKVSDGVE